MSNDPSVPVLVAEVWPTRDRLLFYLLRGIAALFMLAVVALIFVWRIPSMPLRLQSFLDGAVACVGLIAYAASSRFQRRREAPASAAGE